MSSFYSKYRRSEDVERQVKQLVGDDIFVLGSTLEDIRSFWKHVGYQAEGMISEPREVSRTVVDIDCKSHGNHASEEGASGGKDWYDEFMITSKKSKDESKMKSYSLQESTTRGFKIGGTGGLSAGSAFFNLAGGGVKPELGINASYSKDKTNSSTESGSRDTKLSQGYEIVDKLQVAPKKKVDALITTWAVTYEATTILKYTVDADISLPVHYRTHLSRVLGGFLVSTAYVSAREIFRDERDFAEVRGNVTFTRDGKVSYISEQVEIKKTKKDL